MKSVCLLLLLYLNFKVSHANLDYLDPKKLQTKTTAAVQQAEAQAMILKISNNPDFHVIVDRNMFVDNKDSFRLFTMADEVFIKASTGVAAVWGFNYYLKNYCNSHVGWQVRNVNLTTPLPFVDETIVANDRFRYYQNVCTVSYSFVWWQEEQWRQHLEWMALNGINMALAPLGQEAIWAKIYRKLGMTDDEIDEHFTGPAFLSWLRMGNVRGWGGPLPASWHTRTKQIQSFIVAQMLNLGMVPVLPAFAGHVPQAFPMLFPNVTFYPMETWNRFDSDYCCPLFIDPKDPLFGKVGQMFLEEVTSTFGTHHVYSSDPFNEIKTSSWSTPFVQEVSSAIFTAMLRVDDKAVWLLQNWMFVHDPLLWPTERVKAFLTSVPRGRMLVLDLQSEQWPQYYLYDMYFGQPFIWCMLHNFGGTLGMFGNTHSINNDVYEARAFSNSTMIGIGLTPEGINQNYVVYDLMLESAWRSEPVPDLQKWVAAYAERRYGCNATSSAWRYLLKSVYSFRGLNRMRGKYVITRRPSLNLKPWAWYRSHDLFEAWRIFVSSSEQCDSPGFRHDLVDVTRQALQYRAEQLYVRVIENLSHNTWTVSALQTQFLNVMYNIQEVLATSRDFSAYDWLSDAKAFANHSSERLLYEYNALNQITLWGPNGEISDYACKQWSELFKFYYIPRWRKFFEALSDAKLKREVFNERSVQNVIRSTVEADFATLPFFISDSFSSSETISVVAAAYRRWSSVPGVSDLPQNIIYPDPQTAYTLQDTDDESETYVPPTTRLVRSTTPQL